MARIKIPINDDDSIRAVHLACSVATALVQLLHVPSSVHDHSVRIPLSCKLGSEKVQTSIDMNKQNQSDAFIGLLRRWMEDFGIKYFATYVRSPARGLKIVRSIALMGCVLFCYLLFTTAALDSHWKYASPSLVTGTVTNITTPTISIASTNDIQKDAVASTKKTEKPLYYTIHTGQPYDADSALRNVLDLSPIEVYHEAFLRPIETGGEEKLHEIDLRVRVFKKYFDTWEALHVVTDGLSNTALVRDDIFGYIRDAKIVSAFTPGTRIEAMRKYENYRTFLAGMSNILFPWTAPYFSNHLTLHGHMYNAGRGIVVSGSNSQAPYIKTAISSFRAMGCKLPVEVMYLGENDLSQTMRVEVEAIPNVITRDLKQMVNDESWVLEGWAGKAFAAFMSSFREVILLDADVLFFENPDNLFLEPGYLKTGALFFRDRVVFPQDKKNFLRKILPKPISGKAKESRWWSGESGECQEAGVVVIEKWRHFLSVFLTARLNGPDRDDSNAGKGTYSFWWGDKETWWIGFELAGDADYHFHQGEAGNMGTVSDIEPKEKPMEQKDEVDVPAAEDTDDGEIEMNPMNPTAIGQELRKTDEEELVQRLSKEAQREHTPIMESSNPVSERLFFKENTPAKSEHRPTRSRRNVVKRGWFEEALDHKRLNLAGPAVLNLRDQNFILCSPQLLHLSLSGRPMWFNGWIQENKHEASSNVSEFEFFMGEKRSDGKWAEWAIGGNNMCCLKSDGLQAFSEQELDALKLIVDIAERNGALSEAKQKLKDQEY